MATRNTFVRRSLLLVLTLGVAGRGRKADGVRSGSGITASRYDCLQALFHVREESAARATSPARPARV
jgi:hypothetical protein